MPLTFIRKCNLQIYLLDKTTSCIDININLQKYYTFISIISGNDKSVKSIFRNVIPQISFLILIEMLFFVSMDGFAVWFVSCCAMAKKKTKAT